MSGVADEAFYEAWLRCRDEGKLSIERNLQLIDELGHFGLLSPVAVKVWKAAFQVCPGHEEGRTKCHYCGDLGR